MDVAGTPNISFVKVGDILPTVGSYSDPTSEGFSLQKLTSAIIIHVLFLRGNLVM
jgi:hypothetical protein